MLPGDGVTVARDGKFALSAKVPELVEVLPDALVFVERYPEMLEKPHFFQVNLSAAVHFITLPPEE